MAFLTMEFSAAGKKRDRPACYRRSARHYVEVLERREQFLTARIDQWRAERRAAWDQEERAALRFAIAFIRARMEPSGEAAAAPSEEGA